MEYQLAVDVSHKPTVVSFKKNHMGRTPLYIAVSRSHIKLVEYFLDHGADANTVDVSGVYAL